MRVGVVLLLAATAGASGQAARDASGANKADDTKAAALLAQARQALGGEARLAQVQGLTATGQSMRMMPDGGHIGDLRIDVQWPDRMLRTDSSRGPGSDATFVMLRGLDGNTLLRNSKILNGGPGHRMSKPPLLGGSDASAQRYARDELTRLAIGLLLTPPVNASVQAAYGGVAESPDGKADVIAFTGANGFAARVFLDVSSHKPLMMTWRDLDPRVFVILPGSPPGAVSAPGPEPVEVAWYFEDYRSASGIQLPHRISRSVSGTPDEEWTFKTFALNPAFKADTFTDR
jgi:hypothetical protein